MKHHEQEETYEPPVFIGFDTFCGKKPAPNKQKATTKDICDFWIDEDKSTKSSFAGDQFKNKLIYKRNMD